MRKLLYVLLAVFCIFTTFVPQTPVYAEPSQEEIEDELEENIQDQLDDLDLTGLESILQKLTNKEVNIFGSSSFLEKLEKILSGDFATDQNGIFSAIMNLIFDDLLSFIPLMAIIISVAIVFSMVSTSQPNMKKKSISDLIHFVCYGAIIVLVISSVLQIIELTTSTLLGIKNQMDVAFPILLTLLTAIGGTVSVSVYQPAVALLSGTIMHIFSGILLPIFIFKLVFSILSNLTTTVKFEKFANFFSSVFKWIIGCVFTIFMAFVSIQGITAGSIDGISIKTAKYAIKNGVPILGGFLSDGFNIIISSSVLIKNAIGASGLLLLFASIIVPVVKIILFMLCLKLTAAILEPLTDSRISNFISGVSKSVSLLITLILGVAFMYLILTGLIMCTANYF